MPNEKMIDMESIKESIIVECLVSVVQANWKYGWFEEASNILHGATLAMIAVGMKQEEEDLLFLRHLADARERMKYEF